MISKYLNGSILEMLERVKTLKTKIPNSELPDCFYQLATSCNTEIDAVIRTLDKLINDPKYQVEKNLNRKLVDFQSEVNYIDYLENKIVAPLSRWHADDINATKFIQRICKEINYPLLPPVVSRLSQEYYCIDAKFNHMRAPLLEAEFFLHMPDIYHELCHPITAGFNNPVVEKFLECLGKFFELAENYCLKQISSYRKNGGDEEADQLEVFNASWIKWAVEIFCDLFATYTIGPAYAWANLHLCIKRGGNPFQTPKFIPSSHPANHARMLSILKGLGLIGFTDEALKIKEYWERYLVVGGYTINSAYKIAYPTKLLEEAAVLALEGTKAIKINIITKEDHKELRTLLNLAWGKFVEDPINYIAWEKLKREEFQVS